MPSGLFIAKTVFGPSIHGRGTLPTHAIGNDTMTYQLTAIAESTEAKIQMPNQNVLQRPVNRIFPLEIRSAEQTNGDNMSKSNDPIHDQEQDEINRTPRISSVDEGVPQRRAPRKNEPRGSKTRAYEVTKVLDRQLDTPPNHSISSVLSYMNSSATAKPATSKTGPSGRSHMKHDQESRLSRRAPPCLHGTQPSRQTTTLLPYGLRNQVQRLSTTTSTSQQQHQPVRLKWATLRRHHYDPQFSRMNHHHVFSVTANPIF
ncbi:hypothetical protein Y032_0002g1123 [Ancylostoma ceylanicum]|uniref:Uncharacterized protein n=1 Tax=Ancylostoma ceylanicum TaxID=53326 RepID=A0A016VZS8_9BILA|nr:hypothetical protein Y032_0002g1123 [Ancylostoma ceylanicum]